MSKIFSWTTAVLTTIFAVSIVVAVLTIYSTGSLKLLGLEAYSDPEGTVSLTEIHWGLIGVGETSNVTIYLKPTGTMTCILLMDVGPYTPPEAEQYLIVTWDYNGDVLTPNVVYPVTLSLTILETVEGFIDFGVGFTFTAQEVTSPTYST